MDLDVLLRKLGVQIAAKQETPNQLVLGLRIDKGERARMRWKMFIEEILLREHGDGRKQWTIDISQRYFLDEATKSPRMMWRIVIAHSTKKARTVALQRIHDAALQSLGAGIEVTEMPLVGRVDYNTPGGTRGVHGVGEAASLISRHGAGGAA